MSLREVAVIGTGITKFGELWEESLRGLGIKAGFQALSEANVGSEDIDAMYVGNLSAGMVLRQEHVGALIADYCGFAERHIPTTRVEAASASGGLAIREAYMAIAGGFYDIVVVGGAEKMTDATDIQAGSSVTSGADEEWEAFYGATFTALHAMCARGHIDEYGTTREQLSAVPAKNHTHAANNPLAQFPFPVKPEAVSGSGLVSSPLRMLDCAPSSDGAAALVLAVGDKARELCDNPVFITGSGQGSDTLALHDRPKLCRFPAIAHAAHAAYAQSGKSATDIQVAEVHDNFSISEIIALEELGFFGHGKGGPAGEQGQTTYGGQIVVNPSGGLKARGHAPGATGIAQAVEIVQQLQGRADKRQVEDVKVGLCENHGGTAATAVVHVMEVA